MANKTNIVTTASKYDIYHKLLSIASKYTDVENEDFLKTGAMGYVTESLAAMIRDSSYHKSMLYNESFLNTARMEKSIYNWAKMFNIQLETARPAYADIMITIPIDSLSSVETVTDTRYTEKYGGDASILSNRTGIILDRNNPLTAGSFTFHLEKSIMIYSRETVGSGNTISGYNVRYISSESPTTNYHNPTSLDIKTAITTTEGVEYLSFVVRAYQYEIIKNVKQVVSSSFIDTKVHKFKFKDQYVGARLFYQTGRSGLQEITLLASTVDNLMESSPGNIYGYYNLIDNNYLEVVFSSNQGSFMPSANSLLHSDIYVTKGAAGNINYSGDVLLIPEEEELKRIPIMASFFSETAQGGVDTPSVNTVRERIISAISTRDVIVTESDLNNYFSSLTSLIGTINSGEMRFIKKRDDILRRQFSAYVLMRDNNQTTYDSSGSPVITSTDETSTPVIPTNTLDIIVSETSEGPNANGISISPGAKIVPYIEDGIVQYFKDDSEFDIGSDDYYVVPFYTYVNLEPFKKVKYIYNLTSDSSALVMNSDIQSDSGNLIIPSTIGVTRTIDSTTMAPQKHYTVTLTLNTNFDLKGGLQQTTENIQLNLYTRLSRTVPQRQINVPIESDNVSLISSEGDSYVFNIDIPIGVSDDEFGFSGANSQNYGSFIYLIPDGTEASEISVPNEVIIEVEFTNFTSTPITTKVISADYLTLFQNMDDLMFSDIVEYKADIPVSYPSGLDGITFNGVINDTDPTVSVTYDSSTYDVPIYDNTPGDAILLDALNDGTLTEIEDNIEMEKNLYYAIRGKEEDDPSLFYVTREIKPGVIEIRDVPLIHASFFRGEGEGGYDAYNGLISQLFVYVKMLRESLGKLETNTFFDLKFFNTSGYSRYYNSRRVNIDLNMNIYVSEVSEALSNEIRDHVRRIVDYSNDSSFVDVSFINATLRESFPAIRAITFNSLDGSLNQNIGADETLHEKDFVPEYINIQPENLQSIKILPYDVLRR